MYSVTLLIFIDLKEDTKERDHKFREHVQAVKNRWKKTKEILKLSRSVRRTTLEFDMYSITLIILCFMHVGEVSTVFKLVMAFQIRLHKNTIL